jgi:hypothetical protein
VHFSCAAPTIVIHKVIILSSGLPFDPLVSDAPAFGAHELQRDIIMLKYCMPILLFVFSTAFSADVTADLAIARQRAGFSADDIMAWAGQQHDYHLSADDIIRMRDAGVPDDVVKTLTDRALPETPKVAFDPLSHPTPPAGYDGWWNADRGRVGNNYDLTVPASFETCETCNTCDATTDPNVICQHTHDYVGNGSVYAGYGDMNSANEIGMARQPWFGRGVIEEFWTARDECDRLPVLEFRYETVESTGSCSSCSR